MSREDASQELDRAHGVALRLLTHRSRSVAEMRSRLDRRGISGEVVAKEIRRLEEAGLLDDDRFALEKACSLVRRGLGPKAMLARLSSSGVEREPAQAALSRAVEEAGGEEAMAREVVARRYGDLSAADRDTRAKAARYLVRRGFSSRVAGSACRFFEDAEA